MASYGKDNVISASDLNSSCREAFAGTVPSELM
jgi:hypothetical protein